MTTINYKKTEFKFQDVEGSETLMHLEREVIRGDEYGFDTMKFEDGDVIVDIGANVGLVSIVLGKLFPNTKIYSFEAQPTNYSNFLKNIELNEVKNIVPHNLAVYSKDDETLEISLNTINTGSSSCFKQGDVMEKINTICLDTIIKRYGIEKIKFLKIDCEGAEFDILLGSELITKINVDNIGIEIHRFMKNHGKDVNELQNLVERISKNKPKIKIYNG